VKPCHNISLGLLAGGRGSRLNGADKAFICYENEYLSRRILNMLNIKLAAQFISARELDQRFMAMNLQPVLDTREAFSGPLAGIEALLNVCDSEFLLTVPVDLKYLPLDVIAQWLAKPAQPGISLHDGNGLQPLLALWHVTSVKQAVTQALNNQEKAVHRLISQLNFKISYRTDIQIGNLNTPEDFEAP
jgi:molybdenum cofactor guanylyltransferase